MQAHEIGGTGGLAGAGHDSQHVVRFEQATANQILLGQRDHLLCGMGLLGFGALLSMVSGIDPIGAVLTIKTFFLLPVAAFVAGRLLPPDSLRRLASSAMAIFRRAS